MLNDFWQLIGKSKSSQSWILVLEMLLATLLGQVIVWLGVGKTGWFLGAIASGVIVSCLSQHQEIKLVRSLGQAFVGYSVGVSLSKNDLTGFASNVPFLVFLALAYLLSSNLIGYVYARLSGVNLFNALLATVPGALSPILSVAAEQPEAISYVAPVQVMRFTTVAVLLPFFADVSSNYPSISLGHLASHLDGVSLLVVLGTALLGVALGVVLKFPAPSLLGAMLAGWATGECLPLVGFELSVPPLFEWVGQVFLGVAIGQAWARQSFNSKYLTQAIVPVLLTLGLGFISATIVMLLTGWDWLTCVLLTAPGGASEISSIALAVDPVHAGLIAIGHSIRLLILIGGLPLWLFWFRFLDRHAAFNSKG
jgi:hypothetical protein